MGAPERRERRVRSGHVDHGEGADVLRLLIGGHHRHTRERQRPTVAGPRHAAEDARKILAAVHLRAWRDDVEHAADAAALARVHEVETNAGEPRIGGQERAQRVEIDLEPPAGEPRRGRRGQLFDVTPAQLESHVGS